MNDDHDDHDGDDDDDDGLPCSVCGQDGGGYASADVAGEDEDGEPQKLHVDACRHCAVKLLTVCLEKAPDGATLVLRKQQGKLLLKWDESVLARLRMRAEVELRRVRGLAQQLVERAKGRGENG